MNWLTVAVAVRPEITNVLKWDRTDLGPGPSRKPGSRSRSRSVTLWNILALVVRPERLPKPGEHVRVRLPVAVGPTGADPEVLVAEVWSVTEGDHPGEAHVHLQAIT